MGLLATTAVARQSWRMPDEPEKSDRQIWGMALRALRKRNGRTIIEAAQAFEPEHYTPGDPDRGVSVQRWGQIEKGEFRFTDEQRRRLARAAGGDLEELELERARITGVRRQVAARSVGERGLPGLTIPVWGRSEFAADGWTVKAADVSESSFNLAELAAPSVGVTYVADTSMEPKAAPGAPVIFDRARRPKPEAGCVVETNAGEMYPRLYVGEDEEHVFVRSIATHKPAAFRRDALRGVYAVRFWGD